MKKQLHKSIMLLALFSAGYAFAQSQILEGRVLDEKDNTPIQGVKVKVNDQEVTTDISGYYSINLSPGTNYIITVSSTGYNKKEISEVIVKNEGNTHLDIVMDKPSLKEKEIDGVVIRSNARKETIASTIGLQKNAGVVSQVIGVEAIKRSPDRNTGEVLKRVSGVSLFDGKYIVVRGLSDRYNQAMLNGIQLSSTEPDRKTFSFDLFPANVIETLVINKTFIPEYTGEWGGGLIQVNTKDIPNKDFFNVQVGVGGNTITMGQEFLMQKGGKWDFLGIDDGFRKLPTNMPAKNGFSILNEAQKTEIGKGFTKNFGFNSVGYPENVSLQLDGGFNTKVFGKDLGVIAVLNYSNNKRRTESTNRFFTINDQLADTNFDYYTEKYSNDVILGGMLNLSLKLNNNNKISLKNIITNNTVNHMSFRTGKDFEFDPVNGTNIIAREIGFKQTTFYNSTINGTHKIDALGGLTFNWYGSFGILDQYIPLLQRLQYNQHPEMAGSPYLALISNGLSQKSGSVFYSTLSDYLYNAGGDVSKTFTLFGEKQTIKGGYLFQVKDRIYNSRPFSVRLERYNQGLLSQSFENIFNPENFGTDGRFTFDEIAGNQYRYIANTILNAGYLQFDNNFTPWLRAVWGLRVENFDQLVGSARKSDDRFVNTRVTDFLPALNLTFKVNPKMNIRLAGSQTVVRPEFREVSPLAYYDFDLGATVIGNKFIERTKITNADLRWEYYPRTGEIFSVAAFYKNFKKPIELYFNQSGVGTSNTFNYLNVDKADAYGIEAEFRKKLDFTSALRNFTLGGNFAYIKNKVTDEATKIDRPMQGQSPYTINLSLQYDAEKSGWSSTVLFNMIGRRILYVGNDQVPPIWEAPRPLLDFQVAKKIWNKKGEIKLNVSDILNRRAKFYHDLNDNGKYDSKDALAIERVTGTNISLTLGYNF
ncbi:TonB-dependent receptor [Chryseobacterium indologenes]|uniref:TonB-dependent receptor domain-containing protein n=1 Tax=Chryseobacterium indologenes TaxID=253 RepID=UPI000F4DAA1E|nr:TonB-dependent receptor [Chryseobacterium indologenes]AYZ34782.1 TonB-dependent receptor [Chryseobacterium indologenes]MBF6643369.1 TonB-dependent receptor [Chryseobacterium indologenes]MBU3048704.1 TonB-dependent receptor [Chryseobacterium indologenes]MEB4762490.1 TonB-dependent receptor [Chryseobacterium indologenes]QQQ72749.1 TonB-dependent receptor [Chryseobacterium indologenes]